MLSLEEAQAALLAMAGPLPAETVAVEAALGRWLATPLIARRTQPAADLSAMDGYAVRGDDLVGPWRVVGESAAGHPYPGLVAQGEAVRIATGALIPAGADAVIIQENCARNSDHLRTTEGPAVPGRHIRRVGLDFRAGDAVLAAGARVGPAQLALALSAGAAEVAVARRPRVMVVEGGDELAAPGEDVPAHRIPASNGAMVAAMIAGLAVVERRGPVADRVESLAEALDAADADVVVTSGGASVGDHDLVQPALALLGAEVAFWKVAIRPGKPLLVARRGGQIILGLPGNPVSSLVTAHLFLLPLLRRMAGATACLPAPVFARMDGALPAGGARREFRRAVWDGARVRDGSLHDSGALASLAVCNAFIDRPVGANRAEVDDMVPIFPLEWPGVA